MLNSIQLTYCFPLACTVWVMSRNSVVCSESLHVSAFVTLCCVRVGFIADTWSYTQELRVHVPHCTPHSLCQPYPLDLPHSERNICQGRFQNKLQDVQTFYIQITRRLKCVHKVTVLIANHLPRLKEFLSSFFKIILF